MTMQMPDTPNALKEAAQNLQQEQERLESLRQKQDLAKMEAENLDRQAQDLRRKLVKDARRDDAELKDIAEQEKEIKNGAEYKQAKDNYDLTRKESGLDDLAAAKKERRQQIDDAVDNDPELQEMRRLAEVRSAEAMESEGDVQEMERRLTEESRRLITRVAGMQLALL